MRDNQFWVNVGTADVEKATAIVARWFPRDRPPEVREFGSPGRMIVGDGIQPAAGFRMVNELRRAGIWCVGSHVDDDTGRQCFAVMAFGFGDDGGQSMSHSADQRGRPCISFGWDGRAIARTSDGMNELRAFLAFARAALEKIAERSGQDGPEA